MKQTIYAPNTVPDAKICVNKSRLKVYKNVGEFPTYYLQKGQEFMIELFNPTTDVVLAKVILNGVAISQGGLVLNPGQRVFLERYLDVSKKFLFDTYGVANTSEVKKAIENNGDIKIEFYREYKPNWSWYNGCTGTITLNNGMRTTTLGDYNIGTDPTYLRTGTSGGFGGASSYTSGVGLASFSTSNVSNTLGMMDSLNDASVTQPIKKSLAKRSKSIETGRVEKGSESDQTFRYVNKTFDIYAFHTIEYKLLPVSQKINTSEDINVKVYCSNCGHKLGKTDKFCSSCGKKK